MARKKTTARAAEGKQLRRQRDAARRYARRLEKQGYAESARRLRESAGLIAAGRGRRYGEEAKAAAREVKASVARSKSALASIKRFQREASSARRGVASPLTQGMGFTDLGQFPRQYKQFLEKHVSKKGRITEKPVTREIRTYAAQKRFQLMESYFYRSYAHQGLDAGEGRVLGWMGSEGLYPGASNRLGSIVMGTDAESAMRAWTDFWRNQPEEIKKLIDEIAVEIAQNGEMSEATRKLAEDAGLISGSPTGQELQQSYGNARG